VLFRLIAASRRGQQQRDAARSEITSNLALASRSRDEAEIYELVRAAARVVNRLYAREIARVPGRQLQAHHRPGVAEHTATFARTRAGRRRASISRRINGNVRNLTRQELAIAYIDPNARLRRLRPLEERRRLIRVYVEQQIDEEMEAQVELGRVPLEEFHLDIFTRDVHLGEVHANEP